MAKPLPVQEPPTYAKIPDKGAPKSSAANEPARATTAGGLHSDELERERRDRERRDSVAVAAYHLAERRGFEPNHEIDDWLEAEARLDRQE